MPISAVAERTAEQIVAGWRAGEPWDGQESPAGPLFASGKYAEQELATKNGPCSAGTASCVFQSTMVVFCC